jgi:hypothetical protein
VAKLWQLLLNLFLYSFLAWLLYDSTLRHGFAIAKWDLWFAFVVAAVLVLAAIVSLIPRLHAPRVSPGEYPFDD